MAAPLNATEEPDTEPATAGEAADGPAQEPLQTEPQAAEPALTDETPPAPEPVNPPPPRSSAISSTYVGLSPDSWAEAEPVPPELAAEAEPPIESSIEPQAVQQASPEDEWLPLEQPPAAEDHGTTIPEMPACLLASEYLEAPETDGVVAFAAARPVMDTLVEPTCVPHGRPFMLSESFLNPPPERPPLGSGTIITPLDDIEPQHETVDEPPPPAPVSADGTLVMPIEEIDEPTPIRARDSRNPCHTIPLYTFEEEALEDAQIPDAAPSTSQSLMPLALAIGDPVDLPVQRLRPAVAALIAAALTATLFWIVNESPRPERAHAGMPLPYAMAIGCSTELLEPVETSARGLDISSDEPKAPKAEAETDELTEAVSSPAPAPKAKRKQARKPRKQSKARAKTKSRKSARAKTKSKSRSKSKARKPKKKRGGFLSQLPPKKKKSARSSSKKRRPTKKRR